MLYDVKLRISYHYDGPTDHARNLVRLLPLEINGQQRVLTRVLSISPPPAERRETPDFFGNTMTTAVWHAPIDAVILNLRARVDRAPTPTWLDISPPLDAMPQELSAYRSLGHDSPHHFTSASRRAEPQAEMTAFARSELSPGVTSLEAVEAVGRALHREMKFDAEATNVDTPAAEAFANRHGVCQDFTHIMIACLRGIGIPAAYASGFLRTNPPPGRHRLEGADAMHAWVRAWVGGDMGWVEFDPTNNQSAGEDYITVAYGRDYDDVAPVIGTMRGSGGQESRQAVDVIPLVDD